MTHMRTVQDNAMLKLSWKFGESKWNPCWLIALTISTDTNYGLNGFKDFDQCGSFTILSKIIPYWSHPACLVDVLDQMNGVIVLTRMMETGRRTGRRTYAGDDNNPSTKVTEDSKLQHVHHVSKSILRYHRSKILACNWPGVISSRIC